MSLLNVSSLTFGYSETNLFADVSFTLNEGEHVGLIGRNGAGKSTLLKLLQGDLIPDKGTIVWNTRESIRYIDQYSEINWNSSIRSFLMTAYSELFMAEKRINDLYSSSNASDWVKAADLQEYLRINEFYTIDTKVEIVSMGLGITDIGLDREINTLSGGQRTRVLLAKLLLECPDILLLDEPTNYLDKESVDWLSEYLLSFKGAYIIVSHDKDFLNRIARSILCIDMGTVKKFNGTYKDYEVMSRILREQLEFKYHAQQEEIARLEKYISQNKARSATAGMARSREKQLRRIRRIPPPIKPGSPEFHFPYIQNSPGEKLVVRDMQIGYLSPILHAFSQKVSCEKIAVIGINGIGKTTLFRTLVGIIPPLSGSFTLTKGVKIGYCPQDSEMESSRQSVIEWLMRQSGIYSKNVIRSALAKCGVKDAQCQLPMCSLSGGELSRVRLCLLTLQKTNILLLDEPTNHLDILAQEALCKGIIDYPGAVLLICHDERFFNKCCDTVWDISQYSLLPTADYLP